MRKVKIVVMAVFALCAVAAYAVPSAFAAGHLWLNLNNQEPSTAGLPFLVDGLILLHHEPPAILGGGTILIHCTGQFHGLVLPNGHTDITSILSLTGVLNSVVCEVLSSTNSICPAGEKPTVVPTHLQWLDQLILVGTVTEDEILEEPTEKKGEPGWETTCKSIKVECNEKETALWLGNAATGSEFEFTGKKPTTKCSDAGKSTVLGKGTFLDWFVSP